MPRSLRTSSSVNVSFRKSNVLTKRPFDNNLGSVHKHDNNDNSVNSTTWKRLINKNVIASSQSTINKDDNSNIVSNINSNTFSKLKETTSVVSSSPQNYIIVDLLNFLSYLYYHTDKETSQKNKCDKTPPVTKRNIYFEHATVELVHQMLSLQLYKKYTLLYCVKYRTQNEFTFWKRIHRRICNHRSIKTADANRFILIMVYAGTRICNNNNDVSIRNTNAGAAAKDINRRQTDNHHDVTTSPRQYHNNYNINSIPITRSLNSVAPNLKTKNKNTKCELDDYIVLLLFHLLHHSNSRIANNKNIVGHKLKVKVFSFDKYRNHVSTLRKFHHSVTEDAGSLHILKSPSLSKHIRQFQQNDLKPKMYKYPQYPEDYDLRGFQRHLLSVAKAMAIIYQEQKHHCTTFSKNNHNLKLNTLKSDPSKKDLPTKKLPPTFSQVAKRKLPT